MEPLKR